MSGSSALVSGSTLTDCVAYASCVVLSAFVWQARADEVKHDQIDAPRVQFDIPAQPLNNALQIFARVTGQSVFYDVDLTIGRKSSLVLGTYDSREALRRLLDGTGLAAKYASQDAFTLSLEVGAIESALPAVEPREFIPHRDARNVQATLEQALCRSTVTRPGSYRAVVQLWLSAAGSVIRSRLVGSTGEVKRDRAIESSVKTLRFNPSVTGQPEPPMVVLLLPRTDATSDVCSGSAPTAY